MRGGGFEEENETFSDIPGCSEALVTLLEQGTGSRGAQWPLPSLQRGKAKGFCSTPALSRLSGRAVVEHLCAWGKEENERERVRAREPSAWNSSSLPKVVLAKTILTAASIQFVIIKDKVNFPQG